MTKFWKIEKNKNWILWKEWIIHNGNVIFEISIGKFYWIIYVIWLTFQALTFGNGASTNLTVPSDDVVAAIPLDDAFESSAEEFAFSMAVAFDLLDVVLLSPAEFNKRIQLTHGH